jgi:hypothetical protein
MSGVVGSGGGGYPELQLTTYFEEKKLRWWASYSCKYM